MQIIRVVVQVKPESQDAFQQLAKDEFRDVPAKFKGCHRFAYWNSTVNPGEVLLYEEWEDSASFDAYRTSDYFKELGGKMFPMLAGKPDAAYYDGTETGNG